MLDKFNFGKIVEKMEQVKKDLPKLLANDTLNYFVKSYNTQKWDGVKWQEVQRRKERTPEYKYPKKGADARHGRAILVGNGLSESGHLRTNLINSKESATFDSIKFVKVYYCKQLTSLFDCPSWIETRNHKALCKSIVFNTIKIISIAPRSCDFTSRCQIVDTLYEVLTEGQSV